LSTNFGLWNESCEMLFALSTTDAFQNSFEFRLSLHQLTPFQWHISYCRPQINLTRTSLVCRIIHKSLQYFNTTILIPQSLLSASFCRHQNYKMTVQPNFVSIGLL